jgi:hypothetical protein
MKIPYQISEFTTHLTKKNAAIIAIVIGIRTILVASFLSTSQTVYRVYNMIGTCLLSKNHQSHQHYGNFYRQKLR